MSVADAMRLLAVALLVGLVLFGEIPGRGRWARDLANFAHGPALALVTLFVLRLLPSCTTSKAPMFRRRWLAVAIVMPLAALIELLQLLLGRDASLGDLLRDALGIGTAMGFSMACSRQLDNDPRGKATRATGLRLGLICSVLLGIPLLLTAAAYIERERRFPVLVEFDSPIDLYFVAAYGDARISRATLPPMMRGGTPGTVGLQLQIPDDKPWTIALWEPKPNWFHYTTIQLDIANPTNDRLVIDVRLRDQHPRRDRSQRDLGTITIPPHTRQTTPLALRRNRDSGRVIPIDLASVRGVVLARNPTSRATTFYVLRIWLTGSIQRPGEPPAL